jgi:hypothetical protein
VQDHGAAASGIPLTQTAHAGQGRPSWHGRCRPALEEAGPPQRGAPQGCGPRGTASQGAAFGERGGPAHLKSSSRDTLAAAGAGAGAGIGAAAPSAAARRCSAKPAAPASSASSPGSADAQGPNTPRTSPGGGVRGRRPESRARVHSPLAASSAAEAVPGLRADSQPCPPAGQHQAHRGSAAGGPQGVGSMATGRAPGERNWQGPRRVQPAQHEGGQAGRQAGRAWHGMAGRVGPGPRPLPRRTPRLRTWSKGHRPHASSHKLPGALPRVRPASGSPQHTAFRLRSVRGGERGRGAHSTRSCSRAAAGAGEPPPCLLRCSLVRPPSGLQPGLPPAWLLHHITEQGEGAGGGGGVNPLGPRPLPEGDRRARLEPPTAVWQQRLDAAGRCRGLHPERGVRE